MSILFRRGRFLLAELALELSEVQVQGQEGALPASTVSEAIKKVLKIEKARAQTHRHP